MYIYVNLNLPILPSPLPTWCPYICSLHPCLYFSICRQVQLYYFSKFHIYIYIYIYINVRHLFSSFWHFTLKSLGPPWKVLTIIFFSVLFHKIFFECLLCARHGSHLFINWSSPVAPSLQWEIDLKTKKHYTQSIPEGFQGPLLTQEWRGQCPHVLSAGLEPDLLADMLCGRWVRKVHSDYDLGRQGAGSMVR